MIYKRHVISVIIARDQTDVGISMSTDVEKQTCTMLLLEPNFTCARESTHSVCLDSEIRSTSPRSNGNEDALENNSSVTAHYLIR